MERTIRVTGKGKISVKPDTIRLRLIMEGIYPEYDETLQRSSEIVELLKELVKKQGYERKELKTLYFNIDTEYESYQAKDKSWKRRFQGYKYVHRMKIEFPADNQRLGKCFMLWHTVRYPQSSPLNILFLIRKHLKMNFLGKQ